MNSPVSPRRVTDPATGGPPVRRSRRWWWIAAAVLVVVAGVALALFEPWRLFTRSSIDEAAPVAAAASAPTASSSAGTPVPSGLVSPTPTPTPTPGAGAPSSGGRVTTDDTTTDDTTSSSSSSSSEQSSPTPALPPAPVPTPFVDGEHATTGTAAVVQAADGRRFVRLENFSTSDGPDVRVILSDRTSGQPDWGVYDDGRWVELGELKATDGNQNYEIPSDVDLAGLQSVVIWCDRFSVAFGTAPLAV